MRSEEKGARFEDRGYKTKSIRRFMIRRFLEEQILISRRVSSIALSPHSAVGHLLFLWRG